MIAFTPRSGSSYLCERLESTGEVGIPREILNKDLMPIVLQQHPAESPREYLDGVLAARASLTGISGFKTTWFQFVEFSAALPGEHDWSDYCMLYLRRQDLAAQAVSLYRAVRSNVFHTNVPIEHSARERLETLAYDYAEIARWYTHIVEQEQAWEGYFLKWKIEPLCIDYEAVHADLAGVLSNIFQFLGVKKSRQASSEPSVFCKLGGSTSAEWAARFAEEHRERTGVYVRRE